MDESRLLDQAAAAVAAADALLIGAGAGMGVDSGLPDFRGDQGFWTAYPAYGKLGLKFTQLANPAWFGTDPGLAWGFYGHRLGLYRTTFPHDGFAILKRWGDAAKHGLFVFTSNVDGQFQRAGFDPDRVGEVHGSIHRLQCVKDCGIGVFPADGWEVTVDPGTFRAAEPWPACPGCGGLARPNILMFNDGGWDERVWVRQRTCFSEWLSGLDTRRVVAVECGAGKAIPTVRNTCEMIIDGIGPPALLVRLNVRESDVPPGQIGIPVGALAGLRAIDERVRRMQTP